MLYLLAHLTLYMRLLWGIYDQFGDLIYLIDNLLSAMAEEHTEDEQEWGIFTDISSSSFVGGRVNPPQYLMRDASIRSSLLNSIQNQAKRRSRRSRTDSKDSIDSFNGSEEEFFVPSDEEEEVTEEEAVRPDVDIREELFSEYPDPYPHSINFYRVIITDPGEEVPKDTQKACENILKFCVPCLCLCLCLYFFF